MKVTLTDFNKRSLLRRVMELEKRGWECVVPIKPLVKGAVVSEYGNSWKVQTKQEDTTKWFVVMKEKEVK